MTCIPYYYTGGPENFVLEYKIFSQFYTRYTHKTNKQTKKCAENAWCKNKNIFLFPGTSYICPPKTELQKARIIMCCHFSMRQTKAESEFIFFSRDFLLLVHFHKEGFSNNRVSLRSLTQVSGINRNTTKTCATHYIPRKQICFKTFQITISSNNLGIQMALLYPL